MSEAENLTKSHAKNIEKKRKISRKFHSAGAGAYLIRCFLRPPLPALPTALGHKLGSGPGLATPLNPLQRNPKRVSQTLWPRKPKKSKRVQKGMRLFCLQSSCLQWRFFYLQLTILAFLLTIRAFLLTILAFLLTVGAFFLLTVGKCLS